MNRILGFCVGLLVLVMSSQVAIAQEKFAERAKQILQQFSKEPSIREVHAAALKFSLIDQGRIQGFVARARHSGWLPVFRVGYRFNSEDDRTTSFPTATSAILTAQATDLDHRLEFRATWDLGSLIFNKNEAVVYRELKKLVELRTDILKEVTKLFFERRRLQVELKLKPPASLLQRVRRLLRLQELSADLDALTGGFFSRRLKASGLDPYR